MASLTEKEAVAVKKAVLNCVPDATQEEIQKLYSNDTVTINTGRDGKEYAWCIYSENRQSCVKVDTLGEIKEDQIEDLFL
jgi:hypothetical protein